MTRSFLSDDKCGVCGATSPHTHFLTFNSVGLPDLDGRPREEPTSTISWWIHCCSGCGYCAESIALAPAKAGDVVRSEAYQRQLRDPHVPALARAYLCSAMIADASPTDIDAAVAGYSRAAWACDDAGSEEAAAGCRLRAADAVYTLHKFGGHYMDEERSGDFALLVDLYRRAGHFEEAADWTSVGYPRPSTSFFPRLMALQRRLIAAGDASAHSCAEVEESGDGTEVPFPACPVSLAEAFKILEEGFESRGGPWPRYEPHDPRYFHWLLPAPSRDALAVLCDPGSTREDMERVRSEYLEGEAFDLLGGETMVVREVLRFGDYWEHRAALAGDNPDECAREQGCKALTAARAELERYRAWLGPEGEPMEGWVPGVRIAWERTVLDGDLRCSMCGAESRVHGVFPELSLRCPVCGSWQPANRGDYEGDDQTTLILGRRLREHAHTAWMLEQALRDRAGQEGHDGYRATLQRRAEIRFGAALDPSLAAEQPIRVADSEARARAAESRVAELDAEIAQLRAAAQGGT